MAARVAHGLIWLQSITSNEVLRLPCSLTELTLNPVPIRPDGTGVIPPQIMRMSCLQRLDLLRE